LKNLLSKRQQEEHAKLMPAFKMEPPEKLLVDDAPEHSPKEMRGRDIWVDQ
jgi:hypothetical protein